VLSAITHNPKIELHIGIWILSSVACAFMMKYEHKSLTAVFKILLHYCTILKENFVCRYQHSHVKHCIFSFVLKLFSFRFSFIFMSVKKYIYYIYLFTLYL